MKSLWLDCDPGLDDTFAIIYAAHHPSLLLLGVSTSPGNTSLQNTTQNALNVLHNIGRNDVPVFPGSNYLIQGEMKLAEHVHGSNGLGQVIIPTSPVAAQLTSLDGVYLRIIEHKEPIIWANTGSLTNLCLLLQKHPDLKTKISQIALMGGAIGQGNITPAAQFNIYFDPKAYEQVLIFKGDIPLVMIPLEVTHQNIATQQVFDHFDNRNIPFAKAVLAMLRQYKSVYYKNYNMPYPPIHDPCVIHYILHPEEFVTKKTIIAVDVYPTSYGRTNCYFSNPINPALDLVSSCEVATHLKNEQVKFWDIMTDILDTIFSQQVQLKITQ